MSANPTHAGGVVVQSDGGKKRYLLVTASDNADVWVLPKGHIEAGEVAEEAAIREVGEEACVEARVVARLGSMQYQHHDESITVDMYLLIYLGNLGQCEDRNIKWLEYEAALKTLSFEDARAALKEAHQILQVTPEIVL